MRGDKEFEKLQGLIEDMEKEIGKELTRAQRALVEKLYESITRSSTGGKIPKGTELTKQIEKGFQQFQNDEMTKVVKVLIDQMVSIMDAGKTYMAVITGKELSDDVKFSILKRIGVEATGKTYKLIAGGYLETMVYSPEVLTEVKRIAINAVFGDIELTALSKQIKAIIEGDAKNEGKLQKYFKTFAYDVLQRSSRLQLDTIAKQTKLSAAIYAGTVIENTRPFCKERAGKVFTNEEIEEWKDIDFAGKPKEGYDPKTQCGGHNCRHTLRFITKEEAIRRRPELKSYYEKKS